MTRREIIAAVTLYVTVAALTFDFAHPLSCPVERYFQKICIIENLKESAVDAVIWPIYWTERLVS